MSYRFSTAAQFDACLFDRADRGGSRGLRPFAPFARTPQLFATRGAHAPAITRAGEILWHDDEGVLHRLDTCADDAASFPAPPAIGGAARIAANARGLWVASDAHTIELYEAETLARLLVVEIRDAEIIDIASDGRDGVFALVHRGDSWLAVPIDGLGRTGTEIELGDVAGASGMLYLRRAQRFVILARQRLYWFGAGGGKPLVMIAMTAARPCFEAHAIGSDGNSRVFVAGVDPRDFGGGAYVLGFDGDGASLGDLPLDGRDAPATGIAASRDGLLLTGPRGLLRFTTADVIPDGAGEVRTSLITPMLQSPDREDARRWLRVEATAVLPQGASLEISYAATDRVEVRNRLASIAADASIPPAQRMHRMRSEPDLAWSTPVAFHGGASPFAAPIFDVHERYLWVSITLSAAAGSQLPRLSELNVLYPGRTLMEHLPSIYQRSEAQPGSFLRALVGVLETTTQELDGRIAAIASHIHPSTAPDAWLDFVARWLGVPWDDAMSSAQKQAIVARAPELARGRGTRAGLEALLDSLLPGKPRRFRVSDATADFGFAVVGGDGCAGSALPAMLGGFTRWRAELDASTVLGSTRLPCPGRREDGVGRLAGTIRIEVAATAAERKAMEPWLLTLITEMVPLTTRVVLRWVSAHSLRANRLGDTMTIGPQPAPQLGEGAITGLARLPERGARTSATGPDIGTRLR